MGAAYARIDPAEVDRVLLLGPSHHLYTRKCALSASAAWGTPLGDLRVDVDEMERLLERGRGGDAGNGGGGGETSSPSSSPNPLFDVLRRSDDEAEHSLELHTSFIRRVLERRRRKGGGGAKSDETAAVVPPLIPVMVGALSPEAEAATAAALLPLARDPRTLVVVSSDFCHWGSRFQFQSLGEELSDDESEEEEEEEEANGSGGPTATTKTTKTKKNKGKGAGEETTTIADAIERLDRRGMRLIERQDGPRVREYLSKTRNTICGRFPISLFLEVLRQLREEEEEGGGGGGGGGASSSLRHSVRFVAYDQSQRVVRRSESSVSYAAALVRVVSG